MKAILLVVVFFLSLGGCTRDTTEYIEVMGKVERELTGQALPAQEVNIIIEKMRGSGFGSYRTLVDQQVVRTDSRGNFQTSMKTDTDIVITADAGGDDIYQEAQQVVLSGGDLNRPIILKKNKFLKFKIYVKNTTPVNENDKITIAFFSGSKNNYRTAILNLGNPNIFHPAENLPGGGMIGAYDETAWNGTNVNSVVSYNVPENADQFKIYWTKKKNGVETTGFTSDLPQVIDQMNEYYFNY